METEDVLVENSRVHHGRNIRRTREDKGIGQTELAELVHLSQPTVSRYEMAKSIDDDMLSRFARALNVPAEYLKTLEENAPTIIFENNNTVTNNDHAVSSVGDNSMGNEDSFNNKSTSTVNPLDKVSELYERLLAQEKEKVAVLEKRIRELEEKYERK